MDLITALILGVIQGITEWFPISSEAMVTLAGKLLFNNTYNEAMSNALWLHGGTMFSALIYFRKDVIIILKSIFIIKIRIY